MPTKNQIGLDKAKGKSLAKGLNNLLADYMMFYQNTRGLHWNIKGVKHVSDGKQRVQTILYAFEMFAFGCAAGNCFSGNAATKSKQKFTAIQDVDFEEVK